jgi:hypothetical protein
MDEVLLVIQGFVDRQRVERRNAYNLYCAWVQHPVSVFEFCPLPFDDELESVPGDDISAEELYKQAVESGYLKSEWWNN